MESGKAVVYGILFDFDKDTIKEAESKPVLDEVVAALQKHPDWRFRVEGHTDDKGDDAYNLELSARRAAAVVAWLGAAGVDAGRFESQGNGESSPVADNKEPAGRALNQRVEMHRL